MCTLCDEGIPQRHPTSRRDFLKATAATGVAAAGLDLFAAASGRGTTTRIRPTTPAGAAGATSFAAAAVMSMDPQVGDFPQADVLVEGKKIVAVGPNLHAGGADVIDARGRIVMPGFIDTHHHQFETALRSFLADGILINDGSGTPSGDINLLRIHSPHVRAGVPAAGRVHQRAVRRAQPARRRRHDGARHLADPSLARSTRTPPSRAHRYGAPRRLRLFRERGRRSAGNKYPDDAVRIKKQWFSSSDQLVTMIMGGEVYLGRTYDDRPGRSGASSGCRSRRTSSRRSASARPSTCSPRARAATTADIGLGPDNLFIHMTGMSDMAWQKVKDVGAQVSLAVPIEMNMRHGMPPILKMQSLGMEPSLSSDVECTLTADFFTQMRSTMNMQRMLVNQMILDTGNFCNPPNQWPTPAARHAGPAHDARRAALRHHERREGPAAGRQDRLAHAGQGGRHHHPRRHRDQRGAAQPGAGSGRVADGPHQRRDRDRRGQGAQVEGAAARRRS